MTARKLKKPRIQRVVLSKMKELWHPVHGVDAYLVTAWLDGYVACRSLINTIPINSGTRDAFMKWAVK